MAGYRVSVARRVSRYLDWRRSGIGGILGLVILLPFTYGMESVSAFALLLGLYAVTATSDTIASVMLGIPGTAASQATILDGYPLAQKGHAARAFGAAFTVSAIGGVFSAFLLAASIPLILPIILAFNSPELFMLGMLGLAMVGSLSGGSILKGLGAACIGLMISMIGYDEVAGIPRYYLGATYLLDGVPLIPVVLGLFAIPELMELAIKDTSISRIPRDQTEGGGMAEGVRDVFRHKWLVFRCACIGTYVGILPGLGAAVVDWFAYGHAVQSAKDKSQFGQGDIRGVIAPETANNATRGGALIPMLAFGIPGSLGTAILLGALLIQGLKPGPDMLVKHLDVTFSMVWTLVIANILVAGLLMVWSKQVAKVAFIRGHLIVPGVILFVFMGAWLGTATIGDWITCLTMGTIGFIMKRSGWPRPPLVLALILGSILENAFLISMRVHDGVGWLSRPIVLIILVLVILTIGYAVHGHFQMKKADDAPVAGEGAEKKSRPVDTVLFYFGRCVHRRGCQRLCVADRRAPTTADHRHSRRRFHPVGVVHRLARTYGDESRLRRSCPSHQARSRRGDAEQVWRLSGVSGGVDRGRLPGRSVCRPAVIYRDVSVALGRLWLAGQPRLRGGGLGRPIRILRPGHAHHVACPAIGQIAPRRPAISGESGA